MPSRKITKARTHIVVAMDTEPVPSLKIREALAEGILKKYADELAQVIERAADGREGEAAGQYAVEYAELIRNHTPEGDD